MKKRHIFFVVLLVIFPVICFGKIGVGIGTGKIQYEEPVKAGSIYQLPPLTVLNTGDEPSMYSVRLAYQQDQPTLKPLMEWFQFDPLEFELQPNQAQVVKIKLVLPLKVEPGDYFAYVEAFPSKKVEQGVTSIGVAAAAKLYFTVKPANIWEGMYYRTLTFFQIYSPWPWVVLGMILAAILIMFFKKYFKFQIARKE